MPPFNFMTPGPTSPPPYQQPDYRVPVTDPEVGILPVSTSFSLLAPGPLPRYVQPDFRSPIASPGIQPLASSLSFSDAERPSGVVDGLNTTFTLSFSPNPASSLMLHLNGVLQTVGIDFALSGNVITFLTAPASGGLLAAWYRR